MPKDGVSVRLWPVVWLPPLLLLLLCGRKGQGEGRGRTRWGVSGISFWFLSDGRIVSGGVLWLMLWGKEGGGWGWLAVVVGWWGHFVSLGCHLFGGGFVLPMSLRLHDAGFHLLLVR